jgi:hypothetical protein
LCSEKSEEKSRREVLTVFGIERNREEERKKKKEKRNQEKRRNGKMKKQ